MQATYPDAFALKNSGLNAFLHADVGAELNGSPLTILSMLARLGNDPWEQAAGWAALPTAAAIDGLSQSISQMPLAPAALAESRDLATRLIRLLPGKSRPVVAAHQGGTKPAVATPHWSPVAMVWWGIAIWMVANGLLVLSPVAESIAPIERPITIPGGSDPSAVPFPHHPATGLPGSPILR